MEPAPCRFEGGEYDEEGNALCRPTTENSDDSKAGMFKNNDNNNPCQGKNSLASLIKACEEGTKDGDLKEESAMCTKEEKSICNKLKDSPFKQMYLQYSDVQLQEEMRILEGQLALNMRELSQVESNLHKSSISESCRGALSDQRILLEASIEQLNQRKQICQIYLHLRRRAVVGVLSSNPTFSAEQAAMCPVNRRLVVLNNKLGCPNKFSCAIQELTAWCQDEKVFMKPMLYNLQVCLDTVHQKTLMRMPGVEPALALKLYDVCIRNTDSRFEEFAQHVRELNADLNKMLRDVTVNNSCSMPCSKPQINPRGHSLPPCSSSSSSSLPVSAHHGSSSDSSNPSETCDGGDENGCGGASLREEERSMEDRPMGDSISVANGGGALPDVEMFVPYQIVWGPMRALPKVNQHKLSFQITEQIDTCLKAKPGRHVSLCIYDASTNACVAPTMSVASIAVNGFPLNLKDKSTSLSVNGEELAETDITTWSHIGVNHIELLLRGCIQAAMVVQIVHKTRMRTLYDLISSNVLSEYDSAVFRRQLHAEGRITLPCTIPLLCQTTQKRMEVPVRGKNCHHIQCFDLKTFLLRNERRTFWVCPICACPMQSIDLVKDAFFVRLLNQHVHLDHVVIDVPSQLNPLSGLDHPPSYSHSHELGAFNAQPSNVPGHAHLPMQGLSIGAHHVAGHPGSCHMPFSAFPPIRPSSPQLHPGYPLLPRYGPSPCLPSYPPSSCLMPPSMPADSTPKVKKSKSLITKIKDGLLGSCPDRKADKNICSSPSSPPSKEVPKESSTPPKERPYCPLTTFCSIIGMKTSQPDCGRKDEDCKRPKRGSDSSEGEGGCSENPN